MDLKPIHKKENQKKKLFPILIGLFIISIMVLSVLEYGSNKDDENEIKYNNYKFTMENNRWTTYVNNNKISFAYPPRDLENTNADVNYNDLLYATKIYLSYNPEQISPIPVQEFMLNKNILGIQSQLVLACPIDNELCKSESLPIKACNDADESTGVILMEISNKSSIDFSNNCLQFHGSQDDIIKTIDKLVLKRLGIM